MTQKKIKVVVIGGGNGSALALDALKSLADKINLSAIISTADNGGSSGAIRNKFGILPPGDILRAALAMSRYDYRVLKAIFYRNRIIDLPITKKKLRGGTRLPNLGNLFLFLVTQFEGNFERAVRALETAVESVGKAYPVTKNPTTLRAKLRSGKVITGETQIDRPLHKRSDKISRVWLSPTATVNPAARRELEKADFIVLAPGSFYCSLVAAILPKGVNKALSRSRAKLIYVAGDAYEKIGEAGPTRLSEFVRRLEEYLPKAVDVIVYNNAKLTSPQKRAYREKKWGVFEKDVDKIKNYKVVGADFALAAGGLSSEKLSKIFSRLICPKI